MARVAVGYLRADCGKGLSALLSVKADEDWYSERGGRRVESLSQSTGSLFYVIFLQGQL